MSVLDDLKKRKKFQPAGKLPDLPIMTLRDGLTAKLEPRDFVLPGLPTRKVGILASEGGMGKSFWALQAAIQVCTSGFCNFDLSGAEQDPDPKKMGSVLYVSLEDDAYDVAERLQAVNEFWGNFDTSHKEFIAELADVGMLEVVALGGSGHTLFDPEGVANGYFKAVQKKAREMPNTRLIIIDTLTRCADVDQNNNTVMSALLRQFEALATSSGAAVLILHHLSKAGRSSNPDISFIRGAGSIIDNARFAVMMNGVTADDLAQFHIADEDTWKWVKFTNVKASYAPIQPMKWLYRMARGVLVKDTPKLRLGCQSKKSGDDL